MADILSKVMLGVISVVSNPKRGILIFVILLFFPLNLFDYIIYILVNLIILFINVIILIPGLIVNTLIWIINFIIDKICHLIEATIDPAINCNYEVIGIGEIGYLKLSPMDVNIFGTDTCLFTIILSLIGLEFPIW